MKKRLIALMLTLCLCTGVLCVVPAARAASYSVYVVSNTLKVYASASTSSKCLGTMSYGERMSCVAASGSWAQVKNGSGATGYCKLDGLSTSDPNTMSVTAYISSANAPLYKKPDASTAVWKRLRQGASFTAVAITKDNQWVRLKNGNYYGYIQAKYLSTSGDAPAASPTVAPQATPAPVSGTAFVTSDTAKLYQSASTSAKVLATLGYGESLTLISATGDWVEARASSGAKGYCQSRHLGKSDPNTLSVTVTLNAISPIYRIPDESSAVWMKLKKGSSYTAVAVTPDCKWTRIQNGKYFAYIRTSNLTSGAAPEPTPEPTSVPKPPSVSEPTEVFVTANTVSVYKSASASSGLLSTLGYGERATLLAASGGWAQLRLASGATGYCDPGGLGAQDPNVYYQTVYINTANAPIYKLPQNGLAVWTKLKKGASFTAVAITPDGAWFRLKNGKYYGYIPKQYVSASKEEEGQTTAYVSVTSLPVYASLSTESKLLGTMYLGQSLTLIGASDGWAKVRNASGATGYCASTGLTAKDPNTLNKACFARTNGVKLYQQPLTSARVVQTVAQNASLMVVCVSADGEWGRVALQGSSFAYVQMRDLSENKIDDGSQIVEISPVTVYVVPTTLEIYASPSVTAKSLGTMAFGEALTCNARSSSWARVVNASGAVGYCDAEGITTKDPNAYATPLYAQTKGAKIYARPQTSAKVSATLELNEQVTGLCYNTDRSWYRVKFGSSFGYVQASYFATSKMESSEQSGVIGKVVALAKEQLGVPYVYAGQSPKGFDCSGFTYYVFKNAAGISLKRTAHSQGYDDTYPKITNKADLKVGDVLYFNTVSDGDDDLCDHAGIYLGSNQFIHASSGGGKVIISSLGTNNNSYYFRTYSWARRIIS